jgi:hypothetical protein
MYGELEMASPVARHNSASARSSSRSAGGFQHSVFYNDRWWEAVGDGWASARTGLKVVEATIRDLSKAQEQDIDRRLPPLPEADGSPESQALGAGLTPWRCTVS